MNKKMNNSMKKISSQICRLMKHYGRSFVISWKASPLLFIIRVLYELIQVAIPIISLYLSRGVINILSNPDYLGQKSNFFKYIALIIIMQLVSMLLGRLMGNLSTIYNDMIGKQIDLIVIRHDLNGNA